MNESIELLIANAVARIAHLGQMRKIGGEHFITHPLRVSNSTILTTDQERIVAVLHDVLEDTDVTERDLIVAGISKENVRLVKVLTRADGEKYEDYITRIIHEKNDVVLHVKFADLKDNMSDLDENSDLMKRYKAARMKIKMAINVRYGEFDIGVYH